jgi:hypothetical protein
MTDSQILLWPHGPVYGPRPGWHAGKRVLDATQRAIALTSDRRLKPFEALREPIPIRAVLGAGRQVNHSAVQPL